MKKIALLFALLAPLATFAQEKSMSDTINEWVEPLVGFLAGAFFFEPFGFLGIHIPLVVIWLVLGAVFFTFKMKFINLRGFKHALQLVRGDYDNPDDKGEVSHFQALVTALSGTVGLGNIAGVAVAVTVGGAGATFWMIVAGLIGMSSKFIECTLGVKYRSINAKGEVSGGPMYYLTRGLEKRNMKGLGWVLAILFAVLCVGGSFGGGNMFQANQAFAQLSGLEEFTFLKGQGVYFGIVLAILVGIVIIGGIKSIAKVTDKIVPLMVGMYVLFSIIIIVMNISEVGNAFSAIFSGAFSPDAAKGGIIGVLIVGFQRAAFSNEAGVGSASIAHSAAKTDEPVSEGIVALLEPFVDTVVICTMTALVLIFTGFADPSQEVFLTKLKKQYDIENAIVDRQANSINSFVDSLAFDKGELVVINAEAATFEVVEYAGLNGGFVAKDSIGEKPVKGMSVDQVVEAGGISAVLKDKSLEEFETRLLGDYKLSQNESDKLVLLSAEKGVEIHGYIGDKGKREYGVIEKLDGAKLTSAGFSSVFPWFKYVLMIAIVLFAFSTMISWSYYGLKAWTFMFGHNLAAEISYKALFLVFIVIGSSTSLGAVMDFSDMMILGMAFPNILGLLIMSGEVKADLKDYFARVKSGAIKKFK